MALEETEISERFVVSLDSYQGPFDALLSMLAQRKMELSQISLALITEDFLRYVSTLDMIEDADQISSFIDVASVLVEAKSASLLPHEEAQEPLEQSLEALRERDLLFARLLQYRAFKEAGEDFRQRLAANSGSFPHPGYMDGAIAAMLPELAWSVRPEDLARIAASAIANAPLSQVRVDQLHVPMVSLRQEATVVRERLQAAGPQADVTFASLIEDVQERLVVVARFFSLLAFFKQGLIQFKQAGPFESLHIRWVGQEDGQEAEDAAFGDISQEDFA